MTSPGAFTSCLGPSGKSYVFYVNKHGFIKQWQQRNDYEMMNSEGRNEYDDVETHRSDKKPIKTSSKDLACLWLERVIDGRSVIHVRLYYVNENSVISELCLDLDAKTKDPIGPSAGGVWYEGSLSGKGWKAQKDTPISAHYNTDPNDRSIKVYFIRAGARPGDRPTITWYQVKDGGNWKLLDADYEI